MFSHGTRPSQLEGRPRHDHQANMGAIKKAKAKATKASKAEAPDEVTGSSVLRKLIEAGGSIKRVGVLCGIPWSRMGCDKQALLDDSSIGQRGIHCNSVVDSSLREHGWRDDQGKMLAIEIPWTEATWAAEIAKGEIPVGTEMPTPLRKMPWPEHAGGLPYIVQTELEWSRRNFIMDDGNHRTNSMHKLIAEKHKHATLTCPRDCILLDCDPVEDRDKALFSSILSNVRLQEVDKDFLSDKLGQIKLVRQFHVLFPLSRHQ